MEIYSKHSWHPLSDEELVLAIETAEAEIDAERCISFNEGIYEERIYLHSGNTFFPAYTSVTSIEFIVIESLSSEVAEKLTPEKYELDGERGVVYLKMYCVGVVQLPWYIPTPLYVRVRYTAGLEKQRQTTSY